MTTIEEIKCDNRGMDYEYVNDFDTLRTECGRLLDDIQKSISTFDTPKRSLLMKRKEDDSNEVREAYNANIIKRADMIISGMRLNNMVDDQIADALELISKGGVSYDELSDMFMKATDIDLNLNGRALDVLAYIESNKVKWYEDDPLDVKELKCDHNNKVMEEARRLYRFGC